MSDCVVMRCTYYYCDRYIIIISGWSGGRGCVSVGSGAIVWVWGGNDCCLPAQTKEGKEAKYVHSQNSLLININVYNQRRERDRLGGAW